LPAAEREERLRRELAAEVRRPFDLSTGPVFRGSLFTLGETEHALLLTMHHIVADAWTRAILNREIAVLYQAFLADRPSPLPELPIQYADYAAWQRQWMAGEALERQLAYWREQLASAPLVLELPTDKPRPPLQSHRGARVRGALSPELTKALKELGRREGLTLFMVLLAGLDLLLYRYTGQRDILVGTSSGNRSRPETEGLIGFFINSLVLRVGISEELTARELLARVREVCLGAYAHEDLPFERLVQELAPEPDPSRSPLFQVI